MQGGKIAWRQDPSSRLSQGTLLQLAAMKNILLHNLQRCAFDIWFSIITFYSIDVAIDSRHTKPDPRSSGLDMVTQICFWKLLSWSATIFPLSILTQETRYTNNWLVHTLKSISFCCSIASICRCALSIRSVSSFARACCMMRVSALRYTCTNSSLEHLICYNISLQRTRKLEPQHVTGTNRHCALSSIGLNMTILQWLAGCQIQILQGDKHTRNESWSNLDWQNILQSLRHYLYLKALPQVELFASAVAEIQRHGIVLLDLHQPVDQQKCPPLLPVEVQLCLDYIWR